MDRSIREGDLYKTLFVCGKRFDLYYGYYAEIERHSIERMLSKLPPELRSTYEGLLTPTETDAESVKLVKIADKLCAYIKCLTEEAAGNREFTAARKSTEAILDGIDSDELRYFRENMLEAFSYSLDEL